MAAVEHALGFLADYTDVGGGEFLARRFAQEAWPQLALLLHRGPDTALGAEDGGPAPAVVQRTRSAVLTCLLRYGQELQECSLALREMSPMPLSFLGICIYHSACTPSAQGPCKSSLQYMARELAHPRDHPNSQPGLATKLGGPFLLV